jgi:hypothetical protein
MATDGTRATSEGLPRDVIDDLLGDERRQVLLVCLLAQGGRMVVEDLAARVQAREAGTDPEAVEAGRRRAVREEIFQHHLPKLTATGVVEYDSMLGTMELEEPSIAERARDRR